MTETRSIIDVINCYIEGNRGSIPVFNSVAVRLQRILARQDYNVEEVYRLIVADPGLASQVLKISNSSFYAGLTKVATIKDAIVRLGASSVANIVMMATQKDNYQSSDPWMNTMMHDLWRHSLCCAIGSRWLAEKANFGTLAQEAFLAGLLHDVGKLFLLKLMEEIIREEGSRGPEISPALISEVLCRLHSVHGPRVMEQWNLPEAYVIVARDHDKDDWDQENSLLTIVRLANKTCRKVGVHSSPDPDLILFATTEAQLMGVREITMAELEIVVEDAAQKQIN